ncbi:hypothetical protein [Brucella anthropi]|uniref:hypothetical protein n=1 Tax=Brucella anthropi TaxID=529 RepID=UPI003D972DC0
MPYVSIHGNRLGLGGPGELLVDGQPLEGGTKAEITALTPLTGTVGTGNDAMTAVANATAATTDTSAASLTSVNTAVGAINNNLADLQAKVNAIIAALKA